MASAALVHPLTEGSDFSIDSSADRRADIDTKQERVALLLRETGREGLLLLEPENFAWFTSGAAMRGILDPATAPVLYCNPESRWLICGNMDSQRLFDEEIDGLGFQLKEWPWHGGREQLLADLFRDRKLAVDRLPPTDVTGDFHLVADQIREQRLHLTAYEQACLFAVGQAVNHALEATCRNLNLKESEREIAGQLAHRLIHRGLMPVHIGVAADGRSSLYRRHGFTGTTVQQFAVLSVTARKYGLHATASRTVCFGEMSETLKQEQSAVVRVSASYLASTWPDAVPREILQAGRRIYQISNSEHEWLEMPQGYLTGRLAVERLFTPKSAEMLSSNAAVTWCASAGSAVSCDTFLITDQGPKAVTGPESWPVKRIRIQGTECIRPDVLIR